MADDPRLVELLKFYKEKATVTRPEVGIFTGKSIGAIAGVCNRAGITGWLKPESFTDRPCQFPVLRNGQRHVCGKVHASTDSLRCTEHQGKVWNPDNEQEGSDLASELVHAELLKFYKKKATVTCLEVGILTGKTSKEIGDICRNHGIQPWPDIPDEVIRDRGCQFPILRHSERYICGLFRSISVDADPLCCNDHHGLVWNPKQEK